MNATSSSSSSSDSAGPDYKAIWKSHVERLKDNINMFAVHTEVYGNPSAKASDLFELNAGGLVLGPYSREILTRVEGSRLQSFFSGKWDKLFIKDLQGRVFLDVHGSSFKHIMDQICAFNTADGKVMRGNDTSIRPGPNSGVEDTNDRVYVKTRFFWVGFTADVALESRRRLIRLGLGRENEEKYKKLEEDRCWQLDRTIICELHSHKTFCEELAPFLHAKPVPDARKLTHAETLISDDPNNEIIKVISPATVECPNDTTWEVRRGVLTYFKGSYFDIRLGDMWQNDNNSNNTTEFGPSQKQLVLSDVSAFTLGKIIDMLRQWQSQQHSLFYIDIPKDKMDMFFEQVHFYFPGDLIHDMLDRTELTVPNLE